MAEDNINPDYYKAGGIEVIDILRAKMTPEEFAGFLKGNIIKYTLRANLKNGLEDYNKAAWYSQMLAGNDPRTEEVITSDKYKKALEKSPLYSGYSQRLSEKDQFEGEK